ncbi:hypothetical protein ABPG75_003140 [Micractinium tetrahymenae]
MHIAVTGRWAQQQARQGTGGVAAAVAAPAGGSGPFVAASIRATAPSPAAVEPIMTQGPGPGDAIAGAAAATAAPVVRSSNRLTSDKVNAIFIPIVSVRPGGAACPNTLFPSITLDQVRKAVFQEANPADPTVGSTFAQCSYNRTLLTTANSLLADTVELPCAGVSHDVPWTLGQQCNFDDYNGAADAADAVLKSRGIDLSKYKHKVYLLPPSACAFVGLGYQGCEDTFECRVWIGADFWATPQAIIHELLHNLYLAHAGAVTPWSGYNEYADLSGTMGYCCSDRCPNTPHAWQLGWLAPRLLDGAALLPGQTVAATVAAQSSSRFSGLRIVPSWAPGADPLYIGYRTPTGGDAGIQMNVAPGNNDASLPPTPGRLHVYSAPIQGPTDARFTTWQAALAVPGQSWASPQAGVVVRLVGAFRGAAQLTTHTPRPGPPSPLLPAGTAIVVSVTKHGNRSYRLLALRLANGRRVQLQLSQPGQAAGLQTGMRLEVSGRWVQQQQASGTAGVAAAAAAASSSSGGGSGVRRFMAASIRASGGKAARPTLMRAAGVASPGGGVAAAAALTVTPIVRSSNQLVSDQVNAIFIPIAGMASENETCEGTAPALYSQDQVRAAIFEEVSPDNVTVGSTYNKCSYGKTRLTASNSLLADPVELPCSGTTNGVSWSFATCNFDDFNGWSDAADEVLRARGINLDLYKHRVYLLPPSACGFVGLGYVGCDGSFDCRAWIGADFWATPQALVHELGHNLYLGHAGAYTPDGTWDDYADLSGTMGYCCSDRCPNTPHAWQLGWLSVQQLDGAALLPGQTVTSTMASQGASAFSGIQILPSWAAGVDPIFVGYRTRTGGDAGTGQLIAGDDGAPGRLHIYSAPISNTFDPKETNWVQVLDSAGQAWTSNATGLVVRLASAFRGSATVTVCRKAGNETAASCTAGLDADCNGLAGAQEPACTRFLQAGRQQPPQPIRRQPRKVAAPPTASGMLRPPPSPVRRT